MNRRLVLPYLALTAAACRSGTKQLATLRVSLLPRFVSAPVYLAEEFGFFREAGIRLDLQPMTATAEMMPLLAGGSLDIAFAGAIPAALNAILKGAMIRIVAARETAVPGCIHEIYGNRSSFPQGLQDLRVLKGKRIAVSGPASLSGFLLDALLDSAGLRTSDVQLLRMRLSESAPALVAGNLDAVVDEDLEFSLPGMISGPSVGDIFPGFQYSYIYFGRSLIQGDADLGGSFLWAYFRGVRDFLAGKTPQALEKLAASGGMDPSAVRRGCRTRLNPDGTIQLASVQRMIDWSVKRQFLPSQMDPARVTDTRFIEAAQRRLRASL